MAIANFTLPLGPPNYFFSISDNEPGSNSNEQILAHLASQGHSSYQIVLSIQRVPTLTLPLSLLITPLVISGLGVENWSQLLSLSLYNIPCVIALLLTHIFVCSLSPSNNNNNKIVDSQTLVKIVQRNSVYLPLAFPNDNILLTKSTKIREFAMAQFTIDYPIDLTQIHQFSHSLLSS